MNSTSAARQSGDADAQLRAYAGAGFRLFPLHHVIDGKCSCGNANCHSPGKHPRTANGAHDATNDLTQLLLWAKQYPGCNWGLNTDGMVVIDVDPRNGGDALFEILETKHGTFPDTCTQATGGGGRHLVYRARDGVNYPGTLGPGVDVKRGGGSFICVEPSIHASGKPYLWIDDGEPYKTPPTLAPEWLGTRREQRPVTGASISVTPDVLRDLKDALAKFDPDSYDDWIRAGHHLRTLGQQGFALWDEWAQKSPKYGDGKRDPAKVWESMHPQWSSYRAIFSTAQERGWTNPAKKKKRQQAEARAAEARAADPRPLVQLVPGERHKALAAIDSILAGTGRVFQRSGQVVHVSHRAARIHGIEVPESVVHVVDASSRWVSNQVGTLARIEKLTRDGHWKQSDITDDLGGFYIALTEWQLPTLRGIAAVPVLLPDWSIASAHGFNKQTGLWIDWRGGELPVPDQVSRADALAALQRLQGIIKSFSFRDPQVDGTVALAALMAGALRPSMKTCPAFAFVSPQPGTGKSLLSKVIAQVATGGPPLPLTAGHDEAELQKGIATAVLLGAPVTLLDNINADGLNSSLLAVTLTEGGALIRLFGTQQAVMVQCNSLFLLTGNSLWLADDMLRRVLTCDLDAGCENPEFRKFTSNPEQLAHDNRTQILTDVHAVVRGFLQSGVPIDAPPLAGFEDFTRYIRDALVWLGQPDLTEKMLELKQHNPKRLSEMQLLDELQKEFGDRWVSAAEILQRVEPVRGSMTEPNPHLRAVVEELCAKVSSRSLGRLLLRATNRIMGRYVLRAHPNPDKNGNRYRVELAHGNDAQDAFDVFDQQ